MHKVTYPHFINNLWKTICTVDKWIKKWIRFWLTEGRVFYIITTDVYPKICRVNINQEREVSVMHKGKMTFQPKTRQRAKVHGFRARMATAGGRKVLAARRAKGRASLSA